MKNIKQHINKLNLTQQLVWILVVITTVLVLVSTMVVSIQINTFVNREMYSIIRRSQQSIIYRYLTTKEPKVDNIFDYNDPNITHYIIHYQEPQPLLTNTSVEINKQNIQEITQLALTQTRESQNYNLETQFSTGLYVITRINDDVFIATVISQTYQNDFTRILLQLIVFVVALIILIIFVIFLAWVTTVIQPLNRLVRYINSMHIPNHGATLDLERQDEIGDVARAIVEMETEIKRQEKLKMEMIHNVSHDLKTPITTIKSYSESIKDGIYPYETLEKSVDVILENADRLERKAHSLLLLNQLEALEDEPIVLNEVNIKEVVSKVILSLKVVRPEIEVHTDIHNVIYLGDEESWRICIENLLDNAFRYALSTIEVTADKNGIRIYNDGEKMSDDRIAKLFKPYEKGTNGQFGLGLSIVYRMALRMGYETKGYNKKDGVEFCIRPLKLEETRRLKKAKQK